MIKRITSRKAKAQRLYRAIRADYLRTNPTCYRCFGKATDIHHSRGRLGTLLFDTRFFRQVCRKCHNWIGDHPKEARMYGLLCQVGQWNTAPKDGVTEMLRENMRENGL